jgi:hypothetical protein
MSKTVSATTVARLAEHSAIRTTGAFVHQIYGGRGSINGQTNCGLRNGRSSRRALVNLAEVSVDKLCHKCFQVERITREAGE